MKVVLRGMSSGFGALSELGIAMVALVLAATGITLIFAAVFRSVLLRKDSEH